MARVYMVTAQNITVAGAKTLIFINPGTTASLMILRAWVSQIGAVAQQNLSVQLSTQVTAFPTLTSFTPTQTSTSDPVSKITGNTTGAAGTCGINASAEGAGAKTVLVPDAFSCFNGWLWVPTPQEIITLPAGSSSGLGLYLGTTPTLTTGWNAGITYQEV